MDSLTQAVLGAAVGEAVLGRKVGGKAAAWGAVVGTLPDLDVLMDPFLTDVQQLVYHRSFSHALLFAVVAAPLLGRVISRFHRQGPASWRDWAWLAFGALFTHPLLDCFTTYGTQLFQPFSRYPVSLNAIFIIDPLYTVPLATGLIVALRRRREAPQRRRANYLGLGLSCLYLVLTLVNKSNATAAFAEALAQQGLPYDRLATRPTPLNTLLWIAQAEDSTGYWIGLYALFDGDRPISFRRLEKNDALLDGFEANPDVQRLRWFSRGFYTVEHHTDTLVFNDIRFGRTDSWLQDEGTYIFRFRIQRTPAHPVTVEQLPLSIGFDRLAWRPLFDRITLGTRLRYEK